MDGLHCSLLVLYFLFSRRSMSLGLLLPSGSSHSYVHLPRWAFVCHSNDPSLTRVSTRPGVSQSAAQSSRISLRRRRQLPYLSSFPNSPETRSPPSPSFQRFPNPCKESSVLLLRRAWASFGKQWSAFQVLVFSLSFSSRNCRWMD